MSILTYACKLKPPFREELHNATVSVHEEHVCKLSAVWGSNNVGVGHYSYLQGKQRRSNTIDMQAAMVILSIYLFFYYLKPVVLPCHQERAWDPEIWQKVREMQESVVLHACIQWLHF